MKADRRAGIRHAFACVALSLGACSGDTADQSPGPVGAEQSEDALDWKEGSGGTRAYLGPDEVIRCWKLQTRFDCLYAEVFDIRDRIADAPVQRSYYRFLTSRLPARKSQLDGLDTSDGYDCSATTIRDRSTLSETIWKDGKIVAQSAGIEGDSPDSIWTPQTILEQFEKYSISPRRPYFACVMVDEIVTKMGLDSLDSPLLTYESLIQSERRMPESESTNGPDQVEGSRQISG